MPEFVQPIILTLPVQLLAYYVAVFKGTDVDQPRNLVLNHVTFLTGLILIPFLTKTFRLF